MPCGIMRPQHIYCRKCEVNDMADILGTNQSIGEVQIANDVIAGIAGIAAVEVEGIKGVTGSSITGITGRFGKKGSSKGVKMEVVGDQVVIDLSVTIRFGYSIPKVSGRVQDKISTTIKSMTGLDVKTVNVKVAEIAPAED